MVTSDAVNHLPGLDADVDLSAIVNLIDTDPSIQKTIVEAVTGQPDSEEARKAYINRLMAVPYTVKLVQNEILGKRYEASNDIEQLRREARAVICFDARIEQLLYYETGRVSPQTYREVNSVEFIREGSIFPGNRFKLDNPHTWERELLILHKTSLGTMPFLEEAKTVAALNHRRIAEGDNLDVAIQLFEQVLDLYSPNADEELYIAKAVSVGDFAMRGGCCRHKSALVQAMNQEAGIRSKYVRVFITQPHAVVQTYVLGNLPLLIEDPNFRVLSIMTSYEQVIAKGEGDLWDILGMVKLKEYKSHPDYPDGAAFPSRSFNVIWQPRLVGDKEMSTGGLNLYV